MSTESTPVEPALAPADHETTTEPEATTAPGTGLLRRPGLLAAGLCLIAAIATFLTTRSSYFYADDWINLGYAKEYGLGWDLWERTYFGHFAPGHRTVDWIVYAFGSEFAAGQVLMGLFVLSASAALYSIAKRVSGRPGIAVILAVAYAASPTWVSTINWLASSGHVIPSTAATLWAVAAALKWFDSRRTVWLVAAFAAFVFALLFYEKPALLPGYLLAFRYLTGVLGTPSKAMFRSDLPLWIGFVVIGVLYTITIQTLGATETTPASAQQWVEHFRNSWLRGSGPLIIGGWPGIEVTTISKLLVYAAQLVFAAVVVVSIWLRPRAWRAWALFAVGFVINLGLIGAGRLDMLGTSIGMDLRYNAEIPLLLAVTIAVAFSRHLPERADAAPRRWLAATSPTTRAVLATVAVCAFLASTADGYTRLHDIWPGKESRAYIETIKADAAAKGFEKDDPKIPGKFIADSVAPFTLGPVGEPPYGYMSRILGLVAPEVNIDDKATPGGYLLNTDGSIAIPQPPPADAAPTTP